MGYETHYHESWAGRMQTGGGYDKGLIGGMQEGRDAEMGYLQREKEWEKSNL
jgi:hypothetical protein